MMKPRFFFLDLETTGLEAHEDQITETAWIRRRSGAGGDSTPAPRSDADSRRRTPATLQRRDLPLALAYDSAAWLQGLSTRQPHKHVLATYPSLKKLPSALSDFRVTRSWGVLEPEYKDKLPVWRVSTLLAKMAIEPTYYRDWPNVMEWLEEAFKRADALELERELRVAPDTARVRLAYLADRPHDADLAGELMRSAQPHGVTYLGRDRTRSRFVRDYNLVDSLLVPSVKS